MYIYIYIYIDVFAPDHAAPHIVEHAAPDVVLDAHGGAAVGEDADLEEEEHPGDGGRVLEGGLGDHEHEPGHVETLHKTKPDSAGHHVNRCAYHQTHRQRGQKTVMGYNK